MKLRNIRKSDFVAAVCFPATVLMCVHVLLLGPHTLTPAASPPYTDGHERYWALQMRVGSVRVDPPLNSTGESNGEVLLVTPLLRCGSTTLKNLLARLALFNGFTMAASPPRKSEVVHIPSLAVQRDVVKNISAFTNATAIMQSFAYTNFSRFEKKKPILVSLVREPVERAVSWYYHVRAPFQLVERHGLFPDIKFPTRKFLKKDLESCLKNPRDTECRYISGKKMLGHTIEFFCGHDPYCPIFGDKQGLQQAKTVVEREFAVVGVLEEWDKTLAVLEHYIPRYFNKATEIYYNELHGNKRLMNENFYKPKVEQAAKDFLRRNFTIEAEFYAFVRQRLLRQHSAISDSTMSMPSTTAQS
ncbi:heparan sulfate 2-O-sulfotransferase pipe [Procambarus clarkii]|uniref:heparan sulfate 2-O-sulfotransferase pipe n=1 Tax=Procambarus clarkii TaxID=6728 RepID=UPI003742A74C